jgi:hypothetical protein
MEPLYPFLGNMDYIRISNQALSTAYMDTWYNNELDYINFASVEESEPSLFRLNLSMITGPEKPKSQSITLGFQVIYQFINSKSAIDYLP